MIRSKTAYTKRRIDHDSLTPGPSLFAAVRCEVVQNQVVHDTEKVIRFSILDRNDNAPELHNDKRNVTVHLDSPYFNKVIVLKVIKNILYFIVYYIVGFI